MKMGCRIQPTRRTGRHIPRGVWALLAVATLTFPPTPTVQAQTAPVYCAPQLYPMGSSVAVRNDGSGTALGVTVTGTYNVYGPSGMYGGAGVAVRQDVIQTIPRLTSGEIVYLTIPRSPRDIQLAVTHQSCVP